MDGNENLNIIVRLKDEASKQLESLSGHMSDLQRRMQPAADASRSFALGLTAAATAAGGFAVMALKSATNLEQTRIAFETMLGSAEKADVFIKQMVQFAKTTPFELRGLEDASKRLLAYGIAQEDVIPNLKMLGDISAGVGMDKLPQLILAFGQVKAATRLTGMELRQFTEAGVPMLEELSKIMKKPVSEIQKMVSEGQVGFPIVQQALANLTGEGGRFNNLMEKQAKSLGGMWSNLADAWEQFLRGEGAKLIEWGKKLVLMITDLVQNTLPKWIEKIEQLGKFLKDNEPILWAIAGAIIGGLVPAIYAAVTAFAAWAVALAPFLIGGAIIGGIVGGVVWVVKNWEMISSKAREIWEGIADFFTGIWEGIKTTFQFATDTIVGAVLTGFEAMGIDLVDTWQTAWDDVSAYLGPTWDSIKGNTESGLSWLSTKIAEYTTPISKAWSGLWSSLTEAVKMAWESVKDVIKSSINWIIDKVNMVINAINALAQKGAGVFGKNAPQIPNVPMLANGGIVTKPTLAMIGEAGPEAVVPLNKAGGMGGVNITINYPEFRTQEDETRLRRMLDDYFRPIMINNKIA